MMRPADSVPQVFLCTHTVDFRKSIAGLSLLVEQTLQLDPFAPVLYVFTNKRRDKVKILYWGVPRHSCELWRSIIDGSRPPGIGVQAQISNRRVLPYLRDMVVSNVGNGIRKDVRYVLGR